jgi:hypothetical protein
MSLTRDPAQRYLDQARENYRLYRRLRSDVDHLDWAVTLLFYTALQLIQAYLVETAAPYDIPRGHDERSRHIYRKLPQL